MTENDRKQREWVKTCIVYTIKPTYGCSITRVFMFGFGKSYSVDTLNCMS